MLVREFVGMRHAKLAAAVVAALLAALTLGLTFAVGPANARHTCTFDPETRICVPDGHTPPTVSADNASRTVNEGQTATNTGTFSDPDGNSTVTLSASVGSVTKDDAAGTWSWSFNTNDGPDQSQTVTISASDGTDSVTTTFSLTVNNIAPTATFNAPQTSYAGKRFVISLTDPNDPSSADMGSLTYAFDCGSGLGYSAFGTSGAASCPAGTAGTSKTVKGKIRDKDGGVSVEYTRTVTFTAGPPFYPNGRIVFWSTRDGNREIYTMNADGTNQTRLTNNAASDDAPTFSPDGSKIAFQRNGIIYVMNANGTNQTPLISEVGIDAAFSPDGSKIAFTKNSDIWVMNADGTNQTRLTNSLSSDAEPTFSPSGSQIAFMSNRNNNWDIYIMNADGTGLTRLTNDASRDWRPAFSPDGSRIAFAAYRHGHAEIYTMNADGTNQTRLTANAAEDEDPTFSPDGSKIAFTSDRDGHAEIYVMSAVGSVQTPLTSSGVAGVINVAPSWGGAGDTTPPQTAIDSGPSGSVSGTSASFSFSSEPGSFFECRLDGGPFERCESPKEYASLTEGEHTFQVRATDASSNTDPTPAGRTWTVDLTAPSVTGVGPADGASGVPQQANVTAAFSESSMDAATLNGTTFTLTRQGATTPVPATVSYDAATKTATLDPGADLEAQAAYTATVKGGSGGAKDSAGNPLSSDKTWNFTTADTRAPSVSLTAPTDGATVGGTVQLTANATDNVAVDRVEFLVNGSLAGSDATAPYAVNWNSTTFISDGARITARAVDTSNNAATSAAHTVTVDNAPPETTLATSGPSGTVNITTASFSFSSEAGATFECKLDSSEFAPCTSPKSYTGLSNGQHTFSVRARDSAGNVDASPAIRTWSINTTPPPPPPAADTTKPTITGMSPRHRSSTADLTPTIRAVVNDNTTNLQKANIKLYVAGKKITRFSYSAATNKLVYTSPKLPKGKKTVKIVATDAAGNVGVKSWYFTIK